jgi:MFS family permease
MGWDGRLLFATRMVRLYAYGFPSVILALYLAAAGLSNVQIGLLLTLTLLGDTIICLAITTSADRIGRRRMLLIAVPRVHRADAGRRRPAQFSLFSGGGSEDRVRPAVVLQLPREQSARLIRAPYSLNME